MSPSARPLLLLCAALAVAGAATPRQLDAVRHFLERRHRPVAAAPPPPRALRTFTERKAAEAPAPQEPTPTPSPWFDCPTTFGLYPDPYDCASYFQCSYGVPFEQHCLSGLEFNPRSNSCDFPSNIDPPCQEIPYPTDQAPVPQPERPAGAGLPEPPHVQAPALPQLHVQAPAVLQPHVQAPVVPQPHVQAPVVPQPHVQAPAVLQLQAALPVRH